MKRLIFLPLLGASAWAVDFEADIRPLFQERCVECHSESKNKADLRLDAKVHAFRGGESGPALVAGKAAESPLFQRLTATDEDERMPPKGPPLTPAQITAIKTWIDSGAVWPENEADKAAATDKRLQHFAFQPLKTVSVSASAEPLTIDTFITQKLAEKSLSLSPEVDRRTLLRRLHFIVTGLAPTLEEVHAFEKDSDPLAYEKRVDQLLNSRHYGEKWARHWLDVVRFADSNGFETNHERPHAWRYRDYVIDAFNNDKPYDRFMFEQIAGDTVGEDVATGFIVAGPWDRVKGQDKNLQMMQRADELSDMVNATGTAFLGLTLGCAKCHNHKFDPITQTDFYAIQSVFSGVQHGDRPIRPADFDKKQKKMRELENQLAPITAKLASFQPKAALARRILIDDEPALEATTDGATGKEIIKRANPKPILYDPGTEKGQASDAGDATRFPNFATSYRYFTETPGTDCFSWEPRTAGRFRLWLSWGAWPTHAPDARYVLDLDGDLKTTDDQKEIAKINQRQFADATPAVPNARRWSGFRSAGTHALTANSRLILRMGDVRAPTVADMILCEEVLDDTQPSATPHLRTPVTHLANTERFDPVTAKFVRFSITATSGSEPCLDELEIYAVGNAAQNIALAKHGTQASSGGDFANNAKHKLAHINDGLYGNDRSWIAKQKNTGGWVQLELAQPTAINRVEWSRDRGIKGTVYEDRLALGYRVEVSLDAQQWQTVATSDDRLDTRFRKRVLSLPVGSGILESELAQVETLRRKQAQLTEQVAALTAAPLAYAGKFEQPQPTHRLHRGDFLEPREIVSPDGLSVFRASLGSLNLPPDAPEQDRRAAFAKWLTDKRNPLPARVMVNRLWHYTFGTGLVATPSDFGHMGFRPTHPELLDWLATEFIRSGWSVKHIQRLILTSATFRQGNHPQAAAIQVDASNTLLWRFPPRRLDAEIIRDHVLTATGMLDLTPGGPGFLLFEPNANYARNWIAQTRDFEREDYRRMIYALKLRMEPDAIFSAFDVPDSGQVCPSRSRSTTPLQALNLFNSSFLIEQAERLASRATSRVGKEPKQQIIAAFELAYARSPEPDELQSSLAFAKENGLPALCRALLNSNEFLFVE